MTLLELVGKLVMDSSEFDLAVNDAIDDGEKLSKQLNDEFDKVEDGAREMSDTLGKQTGSNTFLSALGEGLVSATGEIVEEIFENALEFGKQSIDAALAADRELEASYSDTMERFDRNLQSLKIGRAHV